MSCEMREHGGERVVVLGFKTEELLYDIENYAYIEGSVMPGDTEAHNRHMVQDAGEGSNADRLRRVLDLAASRCREMLLRYTKNAVEEEYYDDTLKERKMYGIVMRIGPEMSQTTLRLLERLIHEYMVYVAVADWLSITNPGKAETWAMKAREAEMEIRGNIHSKLGRIRRRVSPF